MLVRIWIVWGQRWLLFNVWVQFVLSIKHEAFDSPINSVLSDFPSIWHWHISSNQVEIPIVGPVWEATLIPLEFLVKDSWNIGVKYANNFDLNLITDRTFKQLSYHIGKVRQNGACNGHRKWISVNVHRDSKMINVWKKRHTIICKSCLERDSNKSLHFV